MKSSKSVAVGVLFAIGVAVIGVSVGSQHSSEKVESASGRGEGGGVALTCPFVHRQAIDPIRDRHGTTSSHMHDFFGADRIRTHLSSDFLLKQVGACNASGDRSVYWVPTMLKNGVEVNPVNLAVYLQVPDGVDASEVELPPNELEMVTFKSSWKCSRVGDEFADLPQCPQNALTHLVLEFPHCWDGRDLKFEDGAHVVAADGNCPASYPRVLPRITMEVRYDISSVNDVTFSSGPVTSVHGDLFFVWDQDSLRKDVSTCFGGKVMCGVTWSTEFGA